MKTMKKIAIIGASYLQEPLIQKAKEMGLETHVFAWAANDVGEKSADFFYPISIVEKEQITEQCRKIGVDAICTIASDLAVITVNYVANQLGLPGNDMECTARSTDKQLMRCAMAQRNDPSPASALVTEDSDLSQLNLRYPVIVKPTDRSGSRGVTRLENPEGIQAAVAFACGQSFNHQAVVEEYVTGQEYSVECFSQNGVHQLLSITHKYTTGSPHFIETGHMEPAPISPEMWKKVEQTVYHGLDTMGITMGASHSELKIDDDGTLCFIEIGGRMGGDCIGSHLVRLSTGYDFVKMVIQAALGEEVDFTQSTHYGAAGIRFVFGQHDLDVLEELRNSHPEMLTEVSEMEPFDREVTDSSTRFGYYIICGSRPEEIQYWLER